MCLKPLKILEGKKKMEGQYLFQITSIYELVLCLAEEFRSRRAKLLLANGSRYIN